MRTVNIHTAKTHLSRLLNEVAGGEEVVIAKAGKRVARLVPLEPLCEPRKPGLMRGKIWISDDFDDPLPDEIMAAFRGERPRDTCSMPMFCSGESVTTRGFGPILERR